MLQRFSCISFLFKPPCYKLRQTLLQITAGVTNYDVITNYVVKDSHSISSSGLFKPQKSV